MNCELLAIVTPAAKTAFTSISTGGSAADPLGRDGTAGGAGNPIFRGSGRR